MNCHLAPLPSWGWGYPCFLILSLSLSVSYLFLSMSVSSPLFLLSLSVSLSLFVTFPPPSLHFCVCLVFHYLPSCPLSISLPPVSLPLSRLFLSVLLPPYLLLHLSISIPLCLFLSQGPAGLPGIPGIDGIRGLPRHRGIMIPVRGRQAALALGK